MQWSRMMHVYIKQCFGKISAQCQGVHHLQPCLFVFNKTQIAPFFPPELFHTNIHENRLNLSPLLFECTSSPSFYPRNVFMFLKIVTLNPLALNE
jgi:hypothetical protein